MEIVIRGLGGLFSHVGVLWWGEGLLVLISVVVCDV